VLLTPLGLLAAGPFNDLTGGVHDGNIGLLYDADITKGCVPNVSYCPTTTVTREEMASFLARTAGLGTNPPVANAKALQGYAPSGLARVAAVKKGVAKIGVLGSAIDVATVTVVAPAAGFILITATANASTTATSGRPCLVYLGVNDRSPGGTATSGYSVAPLGNGTGLVEAVTTLAVTYAFPVAAGTRTYAAQMFYRTGTVPIGADTSLTALYVPFGYDGGTTLAPAP